MRLALPFKRGPYDNGVGCKGFSVRVKDLTPCVTNMNKHTLRKLYDAWIDSPECTDEGTSAWIAFLDETIRQGLSTSQALAAIGKE
jgi:hypothetical protein